MLKWCKGRLNRALETVHAIIDPSTSRPDVGSAATSIHRTSAAEVWSGGQRSLHKHEMLTDGPPGWRVTERPSNPSESSTGSTSIRARGAWIHGYRTIGKRPYMEDFYSIGYDSQSTITQLMICDGHGSQKIAEALIRILPTRLFAVISAYQQHQLELLKTVATTAPRPLYPLEVELQNVCVQTERDLFAEFGAHPYVGGSTCVAVLVLPLLRQTVAVNVGDSRALIADTMMEQELFSTRDHTPDDPSEAARIKRANGTVKHRRVNGVLAVSRAFGDWSLKRAPHSTDSEPVLDPVNGPVSTLPDVTVVDWPAGIVPSIVLISDGISCVLKNATILDHLRKLRLSVPSRDRDARDVQLAESLVNLAISAGSTDNLTVIVYSPGLDPSTGSSSAAEGTTGPTTTDVWNRAGGGGAHGLNDSDAAPLRYRRSSIDTTATTAPAAAAPFTLTLGLPLLFSPTTTITEK